MRGSVMRGDGKWSAASCCIICGSPNLKSIGAMTSPFLALRVWDRAPFRCALRVCDVCGFEFFEPRLSESDQVRLYSGYREAGYQNVRESVEPWYTRTFNANLESAELLEKRRGFVRNLFDVELRDKHISSVLDFGGNRGELVADLIPGASPYVYDVSHVQPMPGVGTVQTLAECAARDFDLIVCSNVLEHVSSPHETLRELQSAAGKNSLVFLEMPGESVFTPLSILKRIVQLAWLMVARPRVAFALARPGFIYQMHEHVNCFTIASLDRLLTTAGWQIVSQGSYPIGTLQMGPLRWPAEMLWAFARAPESVA